MKTVKDQGEGPSCHKSLYSREKLLNQGSPQGPPKLYLNKHTTKTLGANVTHTTYKEPRRLLTQFLLTQVRSMQINSHPHQAQ